MLVHSVGTGADETAHSVEWFGEKTVHTTDRTVEDVGKASKTVAVKTADGTKETFVVADHATVDTGRRRTLSCQSALSRQPVNSTTPPPSAGLEFLLYPSAFPLNYL